MLDKIKARRQKRQSSQEIDSLSDLQLRDLGLTRTALRILVETDPAVIERQTEMAKRHGIDPEMLQRDRMELAAIVATCRDCQATRECRAHLADPSRLVDEAGFCPNHAEYSFLADQRIT